MAEKALEIHGQTATSPVASDKKLEETLNLGTYKYYIGSLDNGILPVRVAPYEDDLELGWSDINYDLDDMNVPIGHPIEVVEVVESETGTWAGFLSEGKILYTDVRYARIIDGETCPSVSKKFIRSDDPLSKVYIPEGARAVSPKDNQSWLSLTPGDVRFTYYNFNEHNDQVVDDEDYTIEGINKNPTLRCSEGYYYFILGENERQSEAVTSGEIYGQYKSEDQIEEDKLKVSGESIGLLKTNAYKNLLNYLGKKDNTDNMLMEQHFVLAGLKVNTQTANPNNQKALFAIRASYIDALPDRSFAEIFDEDSPYKNGKNYAFTVTLKALPKICDDLASKFKNVKKKLESSKIKVLDISKLDYNIDIQIEQLERFSKEIDGFLARQAYPALSDNTVISSLASEGTKTKHDHLIQFGIVDNGGLGCSVRETISHILFSPDPKSLESQPDTSWEGKSINLFDFDPYITDEELSGKTGVKRSAVHLKVALPYLRELYTGTYGSRTLHLLLAHSSITKFLDNADSDMNSYDWAEFLQKYCVPPLKIYPSKDPQQFSGTEDIDCDELIKKLNESGPNVGRQEKLLQEQLYNNPKCKEKYFEQFDDATHAGDPSLKKKSLEETNEDIMAAMAKGDDKKFLSVLFQGFFHVLDPLALISLLLACLQKKLGLALSLEAICEAAITELVKSIGPEAATTIIITNALLNPQREASARALMILGSPESPYHNPEALKTVSKTGLTDKNSDQSLVLDERFDGAPIASALVVAEIPIAPEAIETIRNLEKGGVDIKLVPAARSKSFGTIHVSNDTDFGYLSSITPGSVYKREEIDAEIKRLLEVGYTKRETRALTVQNGYMVPDETQWRMFASQPNSFKDAPSGAAFKSALEKATTETKHSPAEDNRKVNKDAKAWISYMKLNIGDIGSLCELIVGNLFDGLESLDFFGRIEDWWEDFMDALKRAFSQKLPSFRFPDNLGTDSHMGDYGKKLLMMLLTMIALILGQIAHLLIKEALEKCLEENNDQGPAPNPVLNKRPASLTIPTLRRAGLPQVAGISDSDLVKWMKDLIDHLTTGQLCALLRGDATKQTLYDCLSRTETNWPAIYAAGIDTIYEIRVAFEKIGKNLDLDICSAISASSPIVTDMCAAIYDSDARCEELQRAGLTKEECDKQIQDELNDMKNKIMALTGLGMFGMDPMKNMLPPACGDDGFFQIPPGVKDTMSRVTDNILTTVKGSLIQDLTSLEFFSVPPRTVIAMTDPNEMMKFHKAFVGAKKNPYSKLCVAYIGNPYDDATRFLSKPAHKCYPMAYNKWLHYGGLDTRRGQGWNLGGWARLVPGAEPGQETKHLEIRHEDLPTTLEEAAEINKFAAIHILKDLEADFVTGWGEYEDGSQPLSEANPPVKPGPENFVENSQFFEPIHIGALYRYKTDSGGHWLKAKTTFRPAMRKAIEKIREKIGADKIDSTTVGYTDLGNDVGRAIEKAISNSFRDDVKPEYLKDLVITKRDLFRRRGGSIGAVKGIPWRRTIPLDKKLKDIARHNEERSYSFLVPMLQHYTGVAGLHKRSTFNSIQGDNDPGSLTVLAQTGRYNWRGADKDEDGHYITNGWGHGGEHGGGIVGSRTVGTETQVNDWDNEQFALTEIDITEVKLDIEYTESIFPVAKEVRINIKTAGDKYGLGRIQINAFNTEEIRITNESDADVFARLAERDASGEDYKDDSYTYDDNNDLDYLDSTNIYKVDQHGKSFIDHKTVHETNEAARDNTKIRMAAIAKLKSLVRIDASINNLKTSPGYVRLKMLYDDMKDQNPDEWDETYGKGRENPGDPGPVMAAFLELTVGEAIGLENSRISGMFPSFGPVDAIKGVLFAWGYGKDFMSRLPNPAGKHHRVFNNSSETGILPQYVVFKQHFKDPASPLSFDKDEMIEYFSSDRDMVNPELYKALTNEDNFNQNIGFTSEVVSNPIISHSDDTGEGSWGKYAIPQKRIISSAKHYNPDIIKIDTSFTELSSRSVGTFNGAALLAKVLGTINESAANASETGKATYESIIKEIEFVSKKESLIYQNIALPLKSNVNDQLDDFRDMYTFIKGKLRSYEPGSIVANNEDIGGEKYNFNFGKKLDDKLQDLIDNLYKNDTGGSPAKKVIEDFKESSAGKKINPLNFKAQIFGKLLARRFYDTFNYAKEHIPNSNISLPGGFGIALRHNLAQNSFSALQMAHVHQAFAKLKDSRLHDRGMMKKLWKKILKNPLNTGEMESLCASAMGQPMSRDDLSGVETDFFNLDDVKQRITTFYEKSLCQDVYEKNSPDDNAARTALLQGCVILLVKVYALEVCLASIIAWDSYDLSDIVMDDILVKIIVKNIKEDIDIDVIAYIANDILRKEKGLSDIELAYYRGKQSGLEYLIKAESNNIVKTAKSLFNNTNPMTMDLDLEVLKGSNINSDEVRKKMRPNARLIAGQTNKAITVPPGTPASFDLRTTGSQIANRYSSFYKKTGLECIHDARFGSNVYTMNYDEGQKTSNPYVVDALKNKTVDRERIRQINLFDRKNVSRIDDDIAYSIYDADIHLRQGNNKNFFHSLPMSHRDKVPGYGLVHNIPGVYTGDLSSLQSLEDAANPSILAEAEIAADEEYQEALLAKFGTKKVTLHSSNTIKIAGHYDTEFGWIPGYFEEVEQEKPSITQPGESQKDDDGNPVMIKTQIWHEGNYTSGGEIWVKEYYRPKWMLPPRNVSAETLSYTDLFYDIYKTKSFFNKEIAEWNEFKEVSRIRDDVLFGSSAFTKENFIENTMGNNLNKLLGNIIIQPYVKIVDIPEDEKEEYWGNMNVEVLKKIDGSDTDPSTGQACEPEYTTTGPINALQFRDIFDGINNKRNEDNNVFRSYMWGYIPISAWSHFYNTVFLKTIFSYESDQYEDLNPVYELYKKYGFRLIFKEFKIGLRLTYTVPTENFDSHMKSSPYKIKNIMEDLFSGEENIKGLKACKALYVQRPYFDTSTPDTVSTSKRIMTELHIPIVEVEKNLTIQEGKAGFTIDDSEKLFKLDDLGFWASGLGTQNNSINLEYFTKKNQEGVSYNIDKLKYLTNTPYSFFYKYLAQDLVKDLKSSPEFRLIFDHSIPINKYMVLGFTYAADGLSKFIPEPTDVLDETKAKILMIMNNLFNSQDYTFVSDDVLSAMGDMAMRDMGGTGGQEPDMTKLILKIIYRTCLMILKGFVELTDPAIIIASTIIKIANMIVMTTLSIIEMALSTAKMIAQGAALAAEGALMSAQIQLQIAGGVANAVLLGVPEVEINGNNVTGADFYIINVDSEETKDWNIEILNTAKGVSLSAFESAIPDDGKSAYENFKVQFKNIEKLNNHFIAADKTLKDIKVELLGAIKDMDDFRKEAKKTMEDFFQSPYLLPGLWAALLPSMLPMFGGIVPPPFMAGPPSTIPGMIYLALLLIDAIDKKRHDDISAVEDDPDCDNQL